MSVTSKSSCVIQEFPLPDREYRVMPPERRPGRTASRSHRFSRRPSILPLALLLALLLFGSGFLLGLTAAAQEPSSPPSQNGGTTDAASSVPGGTGALPQDPPADEVRYLGMPGGETEGGTIPQTVVDRDTWNLLLINGDHPLAEDFSVPELKELSRGHAVDIRIYPDLQAMMDAARAAGYRPLLCSSFRTWETQERLYGNKVQRLLNQGYPQAEAEAEAAMWVARPGTSEHQAGLAVDIVDTDYQLLDQEQENRPVQKWLMAHCAEYGFILRYPTSKSDLTGVGYEPWHYRYVGREAAQDITSRGICLEEYLAENHQGA